MIKENEQIILKVCHVYCKAPADQEDLYQDILIQLWRSYPDFKGRSKLSTWMYRIAFNTAISRFRKQKKTPISQPIADNHPTTENDGDQESIAHLYHAIEDLNKVEKAITLLYLEDLKYREIGEVLGLSETNVGYKINRIKKKLKQKLKQHTS